MKRVYNLFSKKGDQYRLSLSNEEWTDFRDEIRYSFGLELISIELIRVYGAGVTSCAILSSIEQLIADAFNENSNTLLFYYCDFVNPIPATRKSILPQEYRSKLFSLMFQRYCSQKGIDSVKEVVVRIDGMGEPYFFHLIAREEHLDKLQQIKDKVQKDFEK